MHLNHLLPNLRGALALAVTLTGTLAVPAATSPATPPAYPDRAHVSNGCHLSSITYLARLETKYPAEHGEPLVIRMMNADGVRRSHTIALFTWQGGLWCRDEYFGVFPLGCAVEARPGAERLVALAQAGLEKQAKLLMRTKGLPLRPAPPARMSTEQRTTEVTVMAETIPYDTTVYWVRSGRRDVPLAFFRPARGVIAVYDPQHGTGLAECACTDDVKIVSSVAHTLGYRVDGLRVDDTIPLEVLFAVNQPVAGGAR